MDNIGKIIKVTEYKTYGKLPDPFALADGTRISKPEEWDKARAEIYKTAVELQYGTLPPKPEYFKAECLYNASESATYRITAGTNEKQVTFSVKIIKAEDTSRRLPAIVDGDLSFNYIFENNVHKMFTDNNVHVVLFNRVELAPDIRGERRVNGPLYDVYPEYTFGALGAWAWGYSRCVDLLEMLDYIDTDCIAFTGHSRGGKTALLAGAVDERAAIVNPNDCCAGATSCYRMFIKAITEDGEELPSEMLSDLWRRFGFWMGPDMGQYANEPDKLPFDSHFMKALVAPRVLFVSEAASDIWGNPVGTWMTTMAAGEVYRFLGKEENLLWYFRRGYHYHEPEDYKMLLNVIKHYKGEGPIPENFFQTPFVEPPLIYDWRAPEQKEE